MREPSVRRAALDAIGRVRGCVVCVSSGCFAAAATPPNNRHHPVERLQPPDGVHGWDGSVRLVRPSTVLRNRAVHAGVQPGDHTPAGELSPSALRRLAAPCLAWSCHRRARGSEHGVPDHRPTGNHDQQGCLRRQPVAEHRQRARLDRVHLLEWRHCTRASERDRGRRGSLRSSLDTNLDTTYWGIELRCVQSVCTWPGEIQLDQFTVSASEAQGPSITPVADPASLWNQTRLGLEPARGSMAPSGGRPQIRPAFAA